MPTYNALQTDRVERYVGSMLGVRNGGICPTVAPELGLSLELPIKPDMDALAGYIPFGAGQFQAGVAGQYSWFKFANRSTASIAVVQMTISVSVSAAVWLSVFDTVGPAAATLCPADSANWLDMRRLHAAIPLNANGWEIGTNTAAVAPPGLGASGYGAGVQNILGASPYSFPWLVLPPGTCALVTGGNVNTAIIGSVYGFWRDLLPDELSV